MLVWIFFSAPVVLVEVVFYRVQFFFFRRVCFSCSVGLGGRRVGASSLNPLRVIVHSSPPGARTCAREGFPYGLVPLIPPLCDELSLFVFHWIKVFLLKYFTEAL